jgi:hypothetical protein
MESEALRKRKQADTEGNRNTGVAVSRRTRTSKRRKRKSGLGKRDSEKRAAGERLMKLWKWIQPYRDK